VFSRLSGGVEQRRPPDHVPIRVGVILLGAIALACIGGLFYLNSPPDLSTTQKPSDGGDQSSGTAQNPGASALLAQQGQQGVTGSVGTTANEAVSNAASDAQTLGLSGQIVALLGTIAGAAVAGIAGLLVGPGTTQQPPPSGGAGAGVSAGTGGGAGTGGSAGVGGGQPSKAPSPTDEADQISKWADLRDRGIITEREFKAKKRQLMSLEQKSWLASLRGAWKTS
jgi:hypothetical protein